MIKQCLVRKNVQCNCTTPKCPVNWEEEVPNLVIEVERLDDGATRVVSWGVAPKQERIIQ